MFQKNCCKGFLLIELMVALVLGLFLFGLGIHWKSSILISYKETQKRLEAMQQVRNLLDQMQYDPSLINKSAHEHEDIVITWNTESLKVEGNHTRIPFIKPPQSFKFIRLNVSWKGSKISRSTSLLTGVLTHE